jgi:hypothetical protein
MRCLGESPRHFSCATPGSCRILLFVELSTQEIIAMVVGASFAAGLNVYATVATLGVIARIGWMDLPQSLNTLESWWVIGAAVALFAIEFVADKIPAFDLIWNALQTFVRVPVAALLGYAATAQLSPQAQMLSALVAGGIAMAAHSGKFAVRAAVTPSPEPVSNTALSLGEDVAAIGLTWFAATYPYIAAGIAIVLVIIAVLLVRMLIRAIKSVFRGAKREFQQLSAA